MRHRQAPALVLDVVDLHERDRVVAFLTAEHGKKRGVARGARSKYSRFAGQLQLLAKAEIRWFEKEGRDLVRIEDVALLRPAAALQGDLEGILASSYLAEHMMQFAQEDEPSDKLFRLLDATVEALIGGVDRDLAVRYFEVWVLRLSGIFPAPRECPHCGRPLADEARFLESEAALVCPDCGVGRTLAVDRPVLDFLRRTARDKPEAMAVPPAPVLRRVEDLCARVRRDFLQLELRSYQVMQRTLATL